MPILILLLGLSTMDSFTDFAALFKEIDSYNILPDLNESFEEYLDRIMKIKGISNKIIIDRTGLTDATVSRYLSGKTPNRSSDVIFCIIISLELQPSQVEAALRLSGVRADIFCDLRNRIIRFCLDRCSLSGSDKMTVESCNVLLHKRNLKPLTNKGIDFI